MKRSNKLRHKFVEYIPDELEDGTLYVSMTFATVAHRCCCGCGEEVITPLSPSDWKLTFDGEAISLVPSIGNWSFPCRSHYWIERNRTRWAAQWSQTAIAAGRKRDALAKKSYYKGAESSVGSEATQDIEIENDEQPKASIWQRLKRWFLS